MAKDFAREANFQCENKPLKTQSLFSAVSARVFRRTSYERETRGAVPPLPSKSFAVDQLCGMPRGGLYQMRHEERAAQIQRSFSTVRSLRAPSPVLATRRGSISKLAIVGQDDVPGPDLSYVLLRSLVVMFSRARIRTGGVALRYGLMNLSVMRSDSPIAAKCARSTSPPS